ncbi:TPA: hypothetical protein DEP34_02845 [Candidatus Uhrbacteria bacterium]|uniref:Lipoprotein n=2 Tax=Candidatus Uhriibacteriota TaxID=1752732 RepID=A0A0G1Q9C2_9BACT|nr:MAG: hypothetical protein UX45_C0001G0014 [Candidatus Uhrbacteria bacterium GW2011_GWF2_46_218]KKU41422.1 MAG: hypothetical protein UX57_C0004G0126 [Candidatus Uhrbacteria bacterium GW2011_GWE2_46_68]HBK33860.1 hypothetical protein [Candidatus Uhrbacteria bacterium]HCB19300.1 hypothetical protein [Candidatus Uhrbacteria bacterium]
MKLPFSFFLLLPLIFLGVGCTEDLPEDQQIDYEEDVKPLIEETHPTTKVRGSCNVIATASHCEDYIGSIWTDQQMQLHCGGTGTFSFDACPYSENGGCRTGAETIAENMIWSYNYGGQPITGEDLYYESQSCDILEGAEWVLPEDLLHKP